MEFLPVDDHLEKVLEILESRLPDSATVYNTAKLNSKWKEEQRWFSLGNLGPQSLILAAVDKPEMCIYVISADKNMEISAEVKEAFKTTSAINWDESFDFCSIDLKISPLLVEIGTMVFGNRLLILPCATFTMSREKARALALEKYTFENATLGNMATSDGAEFLQKTWKYASENGRGWMEQQVRRNLSAAVFVGEEIVCGVVLRAEGAIGMLYTLEEHRGNKYALATMHRIMRECAEEGLVPCCFVELRNQGSIEFQKKLGFDDLGIKCDFIKYTKTSKW